jgi:hypothetical protein
MNHTEPPDDQVTRTIFWIIMSAAAVFISTAILLVR